ncbi:MAG: ATPase, T2SS/T4P/T4SS family [Sulfuricurvum sp.]|nr:ATPase, T2SS/T4P/T4SS family [Sulfuricurvum sp.]
MAKKITSFDEDDHKSTQQKFFTTLGADNAWFGEMLYDIKHRWNDNGLGITDILVRQEQQVYLGSIKTHIPYSPPTKRKHITDREIKSVVNCFVDNGQDFELVGKVINFSISVGGVGSYRINFSNDIEGACLAIRIHPHTIPQIKQIGYPAFYEHYISSFVNRTALKIPSPRRANDNDDSPVEMVDYKTAEIHGGGLILHCGPTGSGKTTAIAAEFGLLAESTTGRMLTYENPVEYRYPDTKAPVSQFELGINLISKSGNHFEEIPGHLLRNYPAAALIGEARDHKEMKIVLDVGSRGHLVFSTIHAINFAEAISNLVVAVGQDSSLLSSLKAVVAHKLIRNNEGTVFALLEIVILNSQLRKYLVDRDLDNLFRVVYQDGGENIEKRTFMESLKELQREGKILPADKNRILDSNVGLFHGYNGEQEKA